MAKIRVKTTAELEKEFGVFNGKPMVPAPSEDLQGKVLNATKICQQTGNAYVKESVEPLDMCVYTVEKVQ